MLCAAIHRLMAHDERQPTLRVHACKHGSWVQGPGSSDFRAHSTLARQGTALARGASGAPGLPRALSSRPTLARNLSSLQTAQSLGTRTTLAASTLLRGVSRLWGASTGIDLPEDLDLGSMADTPPEPGAHVAEQGLSKAPSMGLQRTRTMSMVVPEDAYTGKLLTAAAEELQLHVDLKVGSLDLGSGGPAVRCDYRVVHMRLPGRHGTAAQPQYVRH